MSKIVTVLVTLAIICSSVFPLASPVNAENGQIAAGVAGGLLGGMLIGGALASPPAAPPPVYYAPPPERVYVEEPACRVVRERYWDGYDWRYRHVEVCD
jgi:hypothetical protein